MAKSMIVAALLVVLAAMPGSAATIINADFESTSSLVGFRNGLQLNALTVGQWDVYTSIPGWATGSGPGIEVQYGSVVPAHSGNFYVELDSHAAVSGPSNSSMVQTLSLSPGSYLLDFWYHPRTNTPGDNTIIASMYPAGSPGTPLVTQTADGISSVIPGWTLYSVPLTVATSGNYNLSFAAAGLENTLGGFLDDISVNGSGPGPVIPEPSTYALVGLGLLAAGLAGRRFAK